MTIKLMEVCGTHTMALFRHGIRNLLPEDVKLISGPGCPVCVTGGSYIDASIELGLKHEALLTTFGDMIRVPGASGRSLEHARAEGCSIKVTYSPLDAIEIAAKNPDKQVVFLSVGFETTNPGIAAAVKAAKARNLKNFSILSANKTIPAALIALLGTEGATAADISGFILPGHVCAIIGITPLVPILKDRYPGVVTGFSSNEIMKGITRLLKAVEEKDFNVYNEYYPVVRDDGNPHARRILDEVFEPCDSFWRGLGIIPDSGLKLREEFADYDASIRFSVSPESKGEEQGELSGCRCGDVVAGRIVPTECPLFSVKCTPAFPIGPCMVSREGSCAAWYRYGGDDRE